MEIYQTLANHFRGEAPLQLEMFGPEELNSEASSVLLKLASSDLVILGLDQNQPLPLALRIWLKHKVKKNADGGISHIPAELKNGKGPGKRDGTVRDLGELEEAPPLLSKSGKGGAGEQDSDTGFIFVERAAEGWGIND